MKNIQAKIREWEDKLEKIWNELSVKKQRTWIGIVLLLYVLLTAVVIGEAWFKENRSSQKLEIKRMQSPILPGLPFKNYQ
ncbi:hypothetical protein [Moheibacter lacus]|uniref:Nitrogen regulatory IIA protein n=1 Tax=Moheibacter lacus TaxID=2745851 RepID=A0A838ZTP9_9FLAO|nr:hypothetical protein [Moheibacter lacus]MBA5630366.1 hypothetical protein [Moheibacter lacus]